MKLYEDLPYNRRAALALHYACKEDDDELERLWSTVPRHSYRMPDMDYLQWVDGLLKMALYWAQQWWQAQAQLMMLAGCQVALQMAGAAEEAARSSEGVHVAQVRLASLRAALDEVCEDCGVQVQTVLELTGAPDITLPVPPDEKQQMEMSEALRQWLPGHAAHRVGAH